MNRKSKEIAALSGILLGLGTAIGPAVIAHEAWNAAEVTTSSNEQNSETLTDIGNLAYTFNLGGLALAIGSGVALGRIQRREESLHG